MKVLIIDDDPGIQEAIKAILEFGGYEVLITDQSDYLFNLSKDNLPGVILLDLLLSGISGKEVARRIKNNSDTKSIPVIMLSAHPSASKAALDSGADDFLAKPFDMDVLLEKIKQHSKK